jgi:hypothetical protein
MFGRSESARERVLIRVIDSQQQLIHELLGKVMELSGHPSVETPFDLAYPQSEPEPAYSALDRLPPGYEGESDAGHDQ